MTTRLDLNLTSKHQFNVVHNWQKYYANPDGVNAIFPFLPGTGTVLGHSDSGGTRRISFGSVGALRSTLTPQFTSEARGGVSGGGNSIFREEITRGFLPDFGALSAAGAVEFVNLPGQVHALLAHDHPVEAAPVLLKCEA